MMAQITIEGLVLPSTKPLKVYKGGAFIRYAFYDSKKRELYVIDYIVMQNVSRIIMFKPVMSYQKAQKILRAYFP